MMGKKMKERGSVGWGDKEMTSLRVTGRNGDARRLICLSDWAASSPHLPESPMSWEIPRAWAQQDSWSPSHFSPLCR